MSLRRPQSLFLFRESYVISALDQLTCSKTTLNNNSSNNCIDYYCTKTKVFSQTERNVRRFRKPSVCRGIMLHTAYNSVSRAVHMQSVHSARNTISLTDMNDDDLVSLLVQNGSSTQNTPNHVNTFNSVVNNNNKLDNKEHAIYKKEDENIVDTAHSSINNEQETEENSNKVYKMKPAAECEREQHLQNAQFAEGDIDSTSYDNNNSSIASKLVSDKSNIVKGAEEESESHHHQSVHISSSDLYSEHGNATEVTESNVKEVSSSFVPVESITESHAYNETYEMFFKIRQHPRHASHRHDGELSWAVNSGMVEWMCCQCQSFNSFTRVVCRRCNASQALSHRCQLPPSRQVVTLPPEWICELCGGENSIRSLEQSLYSSSSSAFALDNERDVQRQIYSSNNNNSNNNSKRMLISSTPSHVKDRLRFFCQHCNEPFRGVREWYCSLCHHINPAPSVQCATCFMNRSARWQCAFCGSNTNSIFVTTCLQCHKERPRKVSDSTMLCANCHTRNDVRWEICAYCISPLPTMRTSILLANEQNKRTPAESLSSRVHEIENAAVESKTNAEGVANECKESEHNTENEKNATLTQVNPSMSETSTSSEAVVKEDDTNAKVILPFASQSIPIIERPTLPHTLTKSVTTSSSLSAPKERQCANDTQTRLSAHEQDSAAVENLYANAVIAEPQLSTPTKVNEDWWWCSNCKVFQRRNVVYCDICLTEQPLWDDKGFIVNGYISTQPTVSQEITKTSTESRIVEAGETSSHASSTSEAINTHTCATATTANNNNMRVVFDPYDWQCPYCRQYHSVHTHSCCNHRRELPSGYWMCGTCHSINRLERVKCLGCNTIPQPEPWICPECELENKSDAFSCINCGSAHVQLWKCLECRTINHQIHSTCVTCSWSQPERLASVECPVCGIPNAPARQTCFRCRTYLWSLQWRCVSCGFDENTHNDYRCRQCHTPRERSLDDRHWVCELCGARTCDTIHSEMDSSTRISNTEQNEEKEEDNNMVVKLNQCPQCYMPRTPNCITYPSWWKCTSCGVYSPAASNVCQDCGSRRRLLGVHIAISCPHCSQPTVIDEREECHLCKASLSSTLSDMTSSVSIGSAVDLITTATSHSENSNNEDSTINSDDVNTDSVNVKGSEANVNDDNNDDDAENESHQNDESRTVQVLEEFNENVVVEAKEEANQNVLNKDDVDHNDMIMNTNDDIEEISDELLHNTNEMKTFTDDYTELSLDDSAITLNSFVDEDVENEESNNEISVPLRLSRRYDKEHVQQSYTAHMKDEEHGPIDNERILHLPMAPYANTRYYGENNTNATPMGNDNADYMYEETQQENDENSNKANYMHEQDYEQEREQHQEEYESSYSIASWHCENCGAVNIKGENEVCVNCQLASKDEFPSSNTIKLN